MDSKLSQWERFARTLPPHEREAFLELVSHMKNRRSAIDAADEPDIGIAMLLAAIVHLKLLQQGDSHDPDKHPLA